MIRIASGVDDQVVYFSAAPGASNFTVDRARNTTSFTAMTTPTIDELGSDGDYSLLLDEDMTIGADNLTEAMVFKVKGDGMTTVRINVELFASDSADIAAIKAKTDDLTFSVANQLDSNAKSANENPIAGGGSVPWKRG